LQTAPQATDLSHGLGATLVRVAFMLVLLLALRAVCLPGGLGQAHFRWPETAAARLAAELRWLTWVLVPTQFLARLAMELNPATAGGIVTRAGLFVMTLALSLFFYRLFHPGRGLLAQVRRQPGAGLLLRALPVWFPLLVVFPLAVLVVALRGYVHSAIILSSAFMASLWLIVMLLLLHGIAQRWLRLVQRRLAWRAATRAEGQVSGSAAAELAELDLDVIGEDSRQLLGMVTTLVALAGMSLIWSAVFPALGILDQVVLWHTAESVNGEERALPISLADLGLASLYLLGMVLLVKRLPALLDLLLVGRLRMEAGNRYTLATLTTYALVTGGTLLALNTLGARWSEVQWLVAALGVGMGFGLQEIVANFVSGLIVLFERPVRIGDMVTVGGIDGVVTRIRIRATTIRNADRKELLVPNKEFITGRLLNWSLSDQVTRVAVTVGVAYGSDVDLAHALMREAALEQPQVLRDPKPVLSFEAFGDSALSLVLRAFIDDLNQRTAVMTELHKAINRKFEHAGIVISAPRKDINLYAPEPLSVRLDDRRAGEP
jgi:potassium efflux system protein